MTKLAWKIDYMGNYQDMTAEIAPNLQRLQNAVKWAFAANRPAWMKALAIAEQSQADWPIALLESTRQEVLSQAILRISEWYHEMDALGANLEEIAAFDENQQALWEELFYMNAGIFGLGPDPLDGLSVSVPSMIQGKSPMLLSPKVDGWGSS